MTRITDHVIMIMMIVGLPMPGGGPPESQAVPVTQKQLSRAGCTGSEDSEFNSSRHWSPQVRQSQAGGRRVALWAGECPSLTESQ